MKTILLTIAALVEVATGLALLVVPSVVVRLLFGAEHAGASIPLTGAAGIALIALGIACWPGRTPLCGMLTYNALATLYFLYLGLRGDWVGRLLWPAVALHAALTLLLARSWRAKRMTDRAQEQSP